MSAELEIVTIAARTAVGLLAETSAAAVRASVCGYREYPFADRRGEAVTLAHDPQLSTALDGRDRLLALARSVFHEVAVKLAAAPRRFEGRVNLWLALPEPRPGLSEQDLTAVAERLAGELRASGTPLHCELAGRGHAGVADALEQLMHERQRDDEALTLVLGVDSYIQPDTLIWLEQMRWFGSDARNGFTPGEAAGALVLASPRLRKTLGLPCLGLISGVATAREHLLRDSETGSFGEGLTNAVRLATASVQTPDQIIDSIYTDINGERYRSEEWGFVAMRAPTLFKTLDYHAPADCWGDVGAASGALLAILPIRAWARGYASGPRALVTTGSTSGLRGAIMLRKPG